MFAGPLKLNDLFGRERRHIVPLFQRPYVWNKEEQWEPLWADVCAVADRLNAKRSQRAHFLGAVVFEGQDKPTGHVETRIVIDGQQRLTTLQILLKALCDLCKVRGWERHARAFEKLTRNEDPLSRSPDEAFKVWPTTLDQEHYRHVMSAGSPEKVRPLAKDDVLIAQAYEYFHDAAAAWLTLSPGSAESRVDSLFNALARGMRLVVIDLDRDDDAQVIFESLNARGTALLPADLIKNHLLHRVNNEGDDLQAAYEANWAAFDRDAKYWRRRRGSGHARRARIDAFFQNYLTALTREEVPASHLFAAYRDFADAREGVSAKQALAEIAAYARTFRGFEDLPPGSREAAFFNRLRTLDATTMYPVLLELYTSSVTRPDARLACVLALESFLVRRMVCGLSTRGYNRLAIEILQALRGQERNPQEALRNVLLQSQSESGRWPDDREFREAWMERPLYRTQRKTRVRMLLMALDNSVRSAKTEQVELAKLPTIEHLLPRKWDRHWPLPSNLTEGELRAASEQRDTLLHTLGNLTLLTQALNSSQQNSAWDDKLPRLMKHSVLALNLELRNEVVWDETRIRARGASLFNEARKLWPHPSGAA